jgi:hypothetical protein
MLPFDKRGSCRGPRTRAALIEELRRGCYTHVFICSHGWNNTFEQALDRYEGFAAGYHALEAAYGLSRPEPYRPVVVGIFWPSIDLILPGEEPPRIAGAPELTGSADTTAREVAELGDDMPADRTGRFYELADRDSLTEAEAWELADLLVPVYPATGDELDDSAGRATAETVVGIWTDLNEAGIGAVKAQPAGPESFGVPLSDRPTQATPVSGARQGAPPGPQAAGRVVARFDPRDILRAFTVCKMKDRAGVVGSAGIAPLLLDLQAADPGARCHLTGHSYGCRVLLSALCQRASQPVDSLLLLEPAVNYLCFAEQVPKLGTPGGYRSVLQHVRQPILSTFSWRDVPLHDLFHLAVRRRRDLGEIKIAALGQVPSLYCALGGWGPGGLTDAEAEEVSLAAPGQRYELGSPAPRARIYGVRSDAGISSHSDVVNEFTFWALYNQVIA